jgi:2-iminoacetate synthase
MITIEEISAVLTNNDSQFLEKLAEKARKLTRKHFGNCISLYAPLYLSNYCENQCLYCGFHQNVDIKRSKLQVGEIHREMQIIAQKGIRNILLLTGESRKHSSVNYIEEAVIIGKKYFSSIGIEIYPLQIEAYKRLVQAGVDSVTIYQETYDRKKYDYYHQAGKKKDYDYRYNTPSRAAKAGIRLINLGVLFGLNQPATELFHLYSHLEELQRDYPGVEYSISVPRIVPLSESKEQYYILSDIDFIKVICLTRILYPHIGITLSTRENATIRDQVINFGITRISAESKTSVGGYFKKHDYDRQFDVIDNRSVEEIAALLKSKGFDPVFTDWRRIQ